ncbi:ABCB family ABC transporter ATP-binding protein/permease [Ascoidea rubescens DSM 1968]|uniref:Iron-sulfur clusters transporter ATM1, mitochondrial n=1 Tax=Ascoidea rubescens DSM 1968 TaxID=1344418 RepID=A0A1D2VNH9_9ASCO|nr:iron-sulfur clusters transporter ATM1, mitochondrial [Ascoidea rubescens DSM 1968]ODV63168.1 iron-sulfur clusters transporter ATM1, mitochondrial [Ascoidea rubescens DSM 1968]
MLTLKKPLLFPLKPSNFSPSSSNLLISKNYSHSYSYSIRCQYSFTYPPSSLHSSSITNQYTSNNLPSHQFNPLYLTSNIHTSSTPKSPDPSRVSTPPNNLNPLIITDTSSDNNKTISSKEPVIDKIKISQWKIIFQLLTKLWPKKDYLSKFKITFAFALLISSKVLNVQVPFYLKSIIDSMNIDWISQVSPVSTVIGSAIFAYGAAKFGSVLLSELRNAVFARVAQNAIKRVATDTFRHLLNLDLSFQLFRQTGGLIKAIDRGIKGIAYILTAMVFHILPTSFEIAMVCSIITYNYGSVFGGVTFLTILFYAYFTIKTTIWRARFRTQMNKADQTVASIATDSLLNYDAVKYFNNESYQCLKYNAAFKKYNESMIDVQTSLAFMNSGQSLIFTTAVTTMMYVACNGIANGSLTVGDLVLINQLAFQLSGPLVFFGTVYRDLKQSLLDMDTLYKFLKVPVEIKDKPDAKMFQYKGGEIKFENVSFSYTPGIPILKNANFTIPPGKKVALVGPSGSGKSTIVKLIFRFYDVDSGRILIDGQDIKDVSLESLRRAIGVVPQDTLLFNDTIYQNIHYGDFTASYQDVSKAIMDVKLDRLIYELPDGLNTVVGERGLMLSAGEKQRISIARLLLKKAPIICFDEATSSLDTQNEQSILRVIRNIYREKNNTQIAIAHKLKTISDSDKIIVLEKGQVIERGKHKDLLNNKKSLYSELWNIQENLDMEEQSLKDDETRLNQWKERIKDRL